MRQQGFYRGLLLLTAGIAIGFSFIFGSDQKSQDPLLINKNGKWGYADATGKFVIQPQFAMGDPFENGFARVWDKKGPPYFINAKAEKISIHNPKANISSDGLIQVESNGKYGFVNLELKTIIEPQFEDVGNFSEGLAPAKMNNKYGYIDRTGKFIIEPQFDDAEEFSEGMAAVGFATQKHASTKSPWPWDEIGIPWEHNNSYGYINKEGEIVIKPTYIYASRFSDGLAAVSTGTWGPRGRGPAGYIDKVGKIIIEFKYTDAKEFSEGLAAVHVGGYGGKYGYIDKREKFIIPPKFEFASQFRNGLAYVTIGKTTEEFETPGLSVITFSFKGVMGYINRTGKIASKKLCWESEEASNKF
jgi:hypothetical protein